MKRKDKTPQLVFNRNEILQGPSPRAIAALRTFPVDHMKLYIPGYYESVLVPELSQKFGVPGERIIVTHGAEDLLRVTFDSLAPDENALFHEFHFDFYHIYLDQRGIAWHEFKMTEGARSFSFDIDDCIAKIAQFRPKLIIITSPNNPTGNAIAYRDFVRVLDAAPKDSIVALDEAYYGFDAGYEEKSFLRSSIAIRTSCSYARSPNSTPLQA